MHHMTDDNLDRLQDLVGDVEEAAVRRSQDSDPAVMSGDIPDYVSEARDNLLGHVFTMKRSMDKAIAGTAHAILQKWRDLEYGAEQLGDAYLGFERRKTYEEAVKVMVDNGLIEGFDVRTGEVRIDGQWLAAQPVQAKRS